MRRRGTAPLPPWSDVEAAMAGPLAGTSVVRATFPLRTVTPVLGGGTRPLDPDPLEPVRLPEVRGMLRWWWRALHQGRQGPEALFAEEARLWGGVDLPTAEGRKAKRSQVWLDVRVRESGQLVAAGRHDLNDRGRPKAAASWGEHKRLRYALFPLQRSEEERLRHEREGRSGPLETRRIRSGVVFDLEVTILEADRERVRQVLLAIWAWIRFGGLGARTRRGFGALELARALRPAVEGYPLEFRTGDLISEWTTLQTLVDANARLGEGARLLVGPLQRRAGDAHGNAVELLQLFRQGEDWGRRRGSGNRPGHSNWPEADLMRDLAGVEPRDPISPEDRAAGCGAPRAAFGLPLQIKFKDDWDKRADATLVPRAGGRWSSPVILRPVAVGGGYRPVALFLAGEGPTQVHIEGRSTVLPVVSPAGAKSPIRPLLDRTGGDALRAFANWLISKQGFEEVQRHGGTAR